VKHPRGNTRDVFKARDKNKDGFLAMDELLAVIDEAGRKCFD
jgi:Ca2+-binding EF-hand superfamily protein